MNRRGFVAGLAALAGLPLVARAMPKHSVSIDAVPDNLYMRHAKVVMWVDGKTGSITVGKGRATWDKQRLTLTADEAWSQTLSDSAVLRASIPYPRQFLLE